MWYAMLESAVSGRAVVGACPEVGALVYRYVCLFADGLGDDALRFVWCWCGVVGCGAGAAAEVVACEVFEFDDELVLVRDVL